MSLDRNRLLTLASPTTRGRARFFHKEIGRSGDFLGLRAEPRRETATALPFDMFRIANNQNSRSPDLFVKSLDDAGLSGTTRALLRGAVMKRLFGLLLALIVLLPGTAP